MPNMGFRGAYAGANSSVGGKILNVDILPALRGNFYPNNYVFGPDPLDTFFNYTTLLVKATGANTQQNYTFVDRSTNNLTLTGASTYSQGAFSPFGLDEGTWSAYFDGTGDYLTAGSSVSLSGDFTVECWIYGVSYGSNGFYLYGLGNDMNSTGATFFIGTTGYLRVFTNNTNLLSGAGASGTLTLNQWNHVAFVRSSNILRAYLNGVLVDTSSTWSSSLSGLSHINAELNGVGPTTYVGGACYISNLRVTTNAVYTSNFTPPTAGLTAISGTSLLVCQSNRFKDNSTNNFTITRNGDAKISAMTPFNQSSSYSTIIDGGSFFPGPVTGGSSAATGFGSGDFTVEFWLYTVVTSWGADARFTSFGGTAGNLNITMKTGIGVVNEAVAHLIQNTGVYPNFGEWNHIAMTRSGSTLRLFKNGVLFANTTTTVGNATGTFNFDPLSNYGSDFRVVKGTALYTANFTPPTAPLTAIANTTLLVSATNAGIIDASRKFNLITDGNAQVSTSISKFGKSIAYDGTGDIVKVSSPPDELNLTTATFTLEAWVYVTSLAAIRGIAGCATTAIVNNASIDWGFRINTDGTVSFLTCSSTALLQTTSTATVSLNTWTHVAVVREGASANVYVNGVGKSGTVHATTNSNRGVLTIGSIADINPMLGYIEDLRLTKGFKRYTADFTPPTSSLPTR